MRTADRVLANAWVTPKGFDESSFATKGFRDAIGRGVKQSTVLVADNVARYVHERADSWSLDVFPTLAPPWPIFWIEYPSTSGLERRGVLVVDATNALQDPDIADDEGPLVEWATAAIVDAEANGVPRDELGWIITMLLFVDVRRAVWGPAGSLSLALDKTGHPVGNCWSLAPIEPVMASVRNRLMDRVELVDPEFDWDLLEGLDTEQQVERLVAAQRAYTDSAAEHQDEADRIHELIVAADHVINAVTNDEAPVIDETWLWRALRPAMQTIAFLHCKNVITDAFDPAPKVQAKRRKKRQQPLVRYHTLRLDVPRRQSDGGLTGKHDIGSPALHIVAGHFSHYGDCCPTQHEPNGRLFGKLEGVYWMPSHVRGSRDAGVVRTDFDLQVPS